MSLGAVKVINNYTTDIGEFLSSRLHGIMYETRGELLKS